MHAAMWVCAINVKSCMAFPHHRGFFMVLCVKIGANAVMICDIFAYFALLRQTDNTKDKI